MIACTNDDLPPKILIGSEGFFVVNEGGFGKGNTSISFYDRDTKTILNKVFAGANAIPLGDQAQSMTLHDGKGFIVVQNSAKIEVVDQDDLTIIETIQKGVVSPRYFVGLSPSKGYVSDWGRDGVTGTVKVIDLVKYEVTKIISTGQGTSRLLLNGTLLYAVNTGGFGRDNTVKVIDTNTDEVTNTITISDNPNSIQRDKEGNFWIATGGHTQFDPTTFDEIMEESTPGAIIKLDETGAELLRLSYGKVGVSNKPTNLTINRAGDQLYYLYAGAVYALSITSTSLPTSVFIDKSFHGLAIDPIDDTIIGCEAPSFSSSGNILIYNASGDLLSTHKVGIGPNSCTFK